MVTLDADMFTAITDMITANMPILITVGIAGMSAVIGAGFIPRILGKFF